MKKKEKSIVLRTFKAFSDLIMLRIILWMENIKKYKIIENFE